MKKESRVTMAAACAVLFQVLMQPVRADLSNGDFSVDFTGNTNPALGWVVTTGPAAAPVDWVDESIDPADAPAAFFYADEVTELNSTLSQTITVAPGSPVLSFDVLMVTEWFGSGSPPETDDFTASLGGDELYKLSSSTLIAGKPPFADLVEFPETVARDVSSFIGLGPVTLEFNLAHDYADDWETTVLVDNVQLVPVPGAVVLGSLGLGFAGLRLRKRRLI